MIIILIIDPHHHHEHHQHHCHHHHQHHHYRRHHHRQCHRCRPLAKLTLGWIIARPWTLRNTLHTTAVAQKYKWKSDRNTRWALLRNTLQNTTVDQKKGRTACRIHWLALNRNTAAPKYSFTRKSLTDTNYEIQHQFPMTACVLNSYDLRLQQIIFGHFATSAGRLFLLLFILHWICQYLYIHVFLFICVFLYLWFCNFCWSILPAAMFCFSSYIEFVSQANLIITPPAFPLCCRFHSVFVSTLLYNSLQRNMQCIEVNLSA